MKIKTAVSYFLTTMNIATIKSQEIAIVEVWRKRKPSYTASGDVNWCSHYGKQYRGSLKKNLKIQLPDDLAIPLLGIYLEKIKTNLKRYMYTMFIEALFTKAKTWKQPKCPLIDEWIKKM